MYKTRENKGLFDEEFTKERLSAMGNPLEAISKVLDFEMFRKSLETKLLNTNNISIINLLMILILWNSIEL